MCSGKKLKNTPKLSIFLKKPKITIKHRKHREKIDKYPLIIQVVTLTWPTLAALASASKATSASSKSYPKSLLDFQQTRSASPPLLPFREATGPISAEEREPSSPSPTPT